MSERADEMNRLTTPHGGRLDPRLIDDTAAIKAQLKEVESFPRIVMSQMEASDLEMLGAGAYSPLPGFMCQPDYEHVLSEMRLSDGLLWPVPITLSVTVKEALELREGKSAILIDPENGEPAGIIVIKDMYEYNREREALSVFGTVDKTHPGICKLFKQKEIHVGGEVRTFGKTGHQDNAADFASPAQVRELFRYKGWQTVAAFQTRNPIHRSHEYLTKIALEICDGLLIHPVTGNLKPDDIPADVRMKCYEAMINNYYPEERVILGTIPLEMRYAGPKEALLHAIIRQNYGCSHIIIGRDHAGAGNQYKPYAAQEIFDLIRENDLNIKPIKLDNAFWCERCGCIASGRTCPHPDDAHMEISGTQLRRMLQEMQRPPAQIVRPEVADILMEYYGRNKQE